MSFPICFSKKELTTSPKNSSSALNSRIQRQLKSTKLLQLKNGLYTTSSSYFNEPEKAKFVEFIASQLYSPSYLSLEYILQKHHLLFSDGSITSITIKTNRTFTNFLGIYKYLNIQAPFYFGLEETSFHDQKYYIATKAKALFDFLYLKPNLNHRNAKKLKEQLFEKLAIQWTNFNEEDFQQFDQYVWKSNSRKMMKILYILNEYHGGKKFDKWAKELLN